LSVADTGGSEAVNERQQLPLQAQQLAACLAEAAIGVRELAYVGELCGRRRDILRPALAAIGEDGAGVRRAAGAVAGRFATAAAEGVKRAGQQRLATEERFEEVVELLPDGTQLRAERAEVMRHGKTSGEWGLSVG
jgi:hypothetical protein